MKKAVKSFISMLLVMSLLMSGFAMIFSSAASNAEYSVELAFNNIFVFEKWAGNPYSSVIPLNAADGSAIGTVTNDVTSGTLVLTNNGKSLTNEVYTGFSMSPITSDNQPYYRMAVEPNTSYTFSYTTSGLNASLQPYIFMFDSDYRYITLVQHMVSANGTQSLSFTTTADTRYIQMRFTLFNNPGVASSVTINDIAIRKADSAVTGEHRKVYTYSGSTTNYYGELPTPTAPEGYVFAGWYTGENGEGRRISATTPVSYESLTVYAKFEPVASALTIKQLPVKTVYTVGERVNLTGLVLEATVNGTKTEVTSGFNYSPEVLTAAGTQTITVNYGGEAVSFTVNVSTSASRTVVVNGTTTNVSVANNVYTLNYTGDSFNRYSMTYYSDAYVQGIITYTDGATEEFFLEPSSNFADKLGTFTSFIDGYLDKVLSAFHVVKEVTTGTRNSIKSISFKPLDNAQGTFELFSIDTEKAAANTSATTAYFSNDEYKMGIDLLNGGVVSELYDLDSGVAARVYTENGKNITKVDYASKLAGGHSSESTQVNLINRYDTGRYLQQSYYGTYDRPYQQGFYNDVPWNYNPVQGGNIVGEASKVIDYEINTEENYIYVKTRPLDWAKWSDRFANGNSADNYSDLYGEDYKTDTYVEAKYVFEDGMIKTYCRMVDFSGYPSATTTQEMPAFYTIEPLNDFVYNNVSADKAWKEKNLTYKEEPDFWGVSPEYNQGHGTVDPDVDSSEHWAAFMASTSADSFGVGVYSPEITDFHYGVYPQIYTANTGTATNYRHAQTTTPDKEDNCALIAPVGVRTFESYSPAEYAFYISTGTVNQIRNSFGVIDDKEFAAELNKGMVVVPETVYMTPSTGASTTGQYYVNNVLDMEAKAATTEVKNNNANGYVQLFVPGAESVTYTVNYCAGTNVDDVKASGEGTTHKFNSDGYLALNTTTISVTTGLTATQTATAEWVFTVKMKDGLTRTYYAYTTLYAPWYQPVGAAAEAESNKGATDKLRAWLGTILWVDGVHSASPGDYKGSASHIYPRTNNFLPLTGAFYSSGFNNTQPITSWIQADSNGLYASVSWLHGSGSNHRRVNVVSPLAALTVDTSRYSNFNQIPNFKVGYMITDSENTDNGKYYIADYTDYNYQNSDKDGYDLQASYTNGGSDKSRREDYYDASHGDIIKTESNKDCNLKYYDIWNRAISTGVVTIKAAAGANETDGVTKRSAWTNNFVQINVTGVNKSALRELVVQGASLVPENYTKTSWDAYYTELKKAAPYLGNPTAGAYNTTSLQKAYNNLVPKEYTVTFDNLIDFSQWNTASASSGTISNVNNNTGSLTLTSNAGVGEATTVSPLFPVTAGESYTVDIDIEGTNWDVYIFFYDDTKTSGTGIEFNDNATRRFSSSGVGTFDSETGKPYFTAPAGATRAVIRLDANGSGNTVTFKNIKVYLKYKTPHIMGSSYEAPVTVKATQAYQAQLPTPTREGYIFEGWYVEKDGFVSESHDAYYYGKNMVFYSSWKGINYTVKFDGNGFAYSDTYAAEYATKITLPDTDAYVGYELLGWSTDKNATAPMYIPGQTVSGLTTTNGDYITLYAVWEEIVCVAKFDANGGTGTVADISFRPSKGVTLPENGFTRDGFEFIGWATDKNATEKQYSEGETVSGLTPDSNGVVTFYAVWEEKIGVENDTIVVDFGLAVKIPVLKNDTPANAGTITGIAATEDGAAGNSLTLTFGTVAFVNGEIIYTPKDKVMMSAADTFWYECRINDQTLRAKVTVVPATSIYYEESFISFNDGKEDSVADEYKHNVWTIVGNAEQEAVFQNADFVGEGSAYGYDSAYDNSVTHSMGAAMKATVNCNSFNKEPTASFTFSGTGFDFYSVTSSDTGAIQVTIKNTAGDIVKNYIVNTYYGYTGTYNEEPKDNTLTPDANAGDNALYQIPVISKRDLAYGTYTVIITPRYSSAFDPNYSSANKGEAGYMNAYSIYVDSVRIFNPAGVDNSTANDAYFADGEYGPQYKTVRNALIAADQSDSIKVAGYAIGSLYFDGTGSVTVATYAKQGPSNEVYLAPKQGIAFNLRVDSIEALAGIQLGMKVVKGSSAKVAMMYADNNAFDTIDISGATEMYYDLGLDIDWKPVTEGDKTYYVSTQPVVIANASADDSTILSLTSLKWTQRQNEAAAVSFMVYPETSTYAMRAMRRIIDVADVNEETVTVTWADYNFVAGTTATLNVTTPECVNSVWVDGVDMEVLYAEDGNKFWAYEVELADEGENVFVIEFLTDSFDPVLTLTEEIYVEAAPVVEEETTEEILPDEDEAEDVETDEEAEDGSIAGTLKNMFDLIFRFFKSVIKLLRGLAK